MKGACARGARREPAQQAERLHLGVQESSFRPWRHQRAGPMASRLYVRGKGLSRPTMRKLTAMARARSALGRRSGCENAGDRPVRE